MNSRSSKEKKDIKALDEMIEKIIVDAYGDDEQLWAFRQVFEDDIDLPADGFVIGEPVSVLEIDYDGNERRGLTARCRSSLPIAGGSTSIPSLPRNRPLTVASGSAREQPMTST